MHRESMTRRGRQMIGRALVVAVVLASGFGLAATPARGAITYTDLYTLGTPAGYTSINATDYRHPFTSGQVVGYATTPGDNTHATLWNGPSPIVLDPGLFTNSVAAATTGNQQVGSGIGPTTGNFYHALLWSGSAASVVDLHPNGYAESVGLDINGSQQVGRGFINDPVAGFVPHAILWDGTAASAVDLNPAGFVGCSAFSWCSGDLRHSS